MKYNLECVTCGFILKNFDLKQDELKKVSCPQCSNNTFKKFFGNIRPSPDESLKRKTCGFC